VERDLELKKQEQALILKTYDLDQLEELSQLQVVVKSPKLMGNAKNRYELTEDGTPSKMTLPSDMLPST